MVLISKSTECAQNNYLVSSKPIATVKETVYLGYMIVTHKMCGERLITLYIGDCLNILIILTKQNRFIHLFKQTIIWPLQSQLMTAQLPTTELRAQTVPKKHLTSCWLLTGAAKI